MHVLSNESMGAYDNNRLLFAFLCINELDFELDTLILFIISGFRQKAKDKPKGGRK